MSSEKNVLDLVVLDEVADLSGKSATVYDNITGSPYGLAGEVIIGINEQLQTAKEDIQDIQAVEVIAGNGLIGGGDLSGNRTLAISSANDGIKVNADNIELATIDALNSTSTTKPLSANQGKVLDEKISMSQGGLLGGIAHNAAAPTPATNGRYVFTSAGSCSWITGGAITVSINDEVLVTYSAPSTYTYTYLAVASNFASASQLNASALTTNYLPLWDGSKFVNSGISENLGILKFDYVAIGGIVGGYGSVIRRFSSDVLLIGVPGTTASQSLTITKSNGSPVATFLGDGSVFVGYDTNPASYKFAVNGTGFFNGDVKATTFTEGTTLLSNKYIAKPLNDEWITSIDYAGNIVNLFKLSKDNIIEFAQRVGISKLFHVANQGVSDIVDIPVNALSPDNTEHGVGISVGGKRILKVSALSDGAGSVDNLLVTLETGTKIKIGAASYALPETDGTNGQVLTTNGSGVLSWTNKA